MATTKWAKVESVQQSGKDLECQGGAYSYIKVLPY